MILLCKISKSGSAPDFLKALEEVDLSFIDNISIPYLQRFLIGISRCQVV